MSKPTIAIDIDDVLADENGGMRDFINERYGLDLSQADYEIPAPFWGYWHKVWGVDDEEGTRRYQAYLESGVSRKHLVKPGAIDAIAQLKKKYKLVIITSRHDTHIDLTHAWLDEHFPKAFEEVAFMAVWSGDRKASKAEIATKLGVQYLVDDNVEHCSLANEAGIQAVLFGEYGWSRGAKLPAGIVRCKDWGAVLEYFDGRDG